LWPDAKIVISEREKRVPLYTFILDYRGGTYISQVRAPSYKTAPRVWAEKLDLTAIANLEKGFGDKIAASISEEKPTPLDGVSKTWCLSLFYVKELALVHFIQTAE
jgi:hypothetical protein